MESTLTNNNPMVSLALLGATLLPAENILSDFVTEYAHTLVDLRWMIALGVILVIADFWFGISESKQRKRKIRRSSACRKTLNKMVDYFLYITLGSLLGKALGEYYGLDPIIISVSTIILCYAFEIDSIYGHICAIHGIKKHYSIWKLIGMLLSLRFKAFGEQMRDMNNQIKEKSKQTES